MKVKYITILLLSILLSSCSSHKNIKKLRFIGEQIIPANTTFKNTIVGGLSSIEYVNEKYYLISDDKDKPIRFYEMELDYDQANFTNISITDVILINNNTKGIDPEGLRFDKVTNHFYWTSEGDIRKGVSPVVFEIDLDGKDIKTHQTSEIFQAKHNSNTNGTRRNGTFEGLSMSVNPKHYWLGMELPLKQDGEEPKLEDGSYPIRISKLNKQTDELVFQFAYQLDKIPKNSIPENKFIVNGCPEILEIDKNNFLFIERAYASGHKNGGNTVKIYAVDCSKATDITKIKSLKNIKYIAATKTLLFDFETIRSKLTNRIVDNIEGITFGKKLANGNRSLIVVSDNNFNTFNPQLNQIIVFEVID